MCMDSVLTVTTQRHGPLWMSFATCFGRHVNVCPTSVEHTLTDMGGYFVCVCVIFERARVYVPSAGCWRRCWIFFFCPMCSWLAHAVNLSFVHECLCVCVRVCEFNDDDGYKNGWTIENYSNKRLIVHMCDGLAAAGSDVRRGGWRHTVARQDAPYFVRCICSF